MIGNGTANVGERDRHDRAWRARVLGPIIARAYDPGEHVGQESFASASEILSLARAAGVASGSRVLELCCGLGGPTLYLARELDCRITGVDLSAQAVGIARAAAAESRLESRVCFLAADATRLPLASGFDAVLLLETMLSIQEKGRLLGEVRRVLRPAGRFAFTLEEGRPLSSRERESIPGGEGIWLVTEEEFLALIEGSGFAKHHRVDCTSAHAAVAGRMVEVLSRDRDAVIGQMGADLYRQVLAFHERWVEWMKGGRVRILAMAVERKA